MTYSLFKKIIPIYLVLLSLSLISYFVFDVDKDALQSSIENSPYLFLIICSLYLLDIFLNIPTLFLTILSGTLLQELGYLASFLGLFIQGYLCYLIGYLKKDSSPCSISKTQFLFSRLIPMLPETLFITSGRNRIPLSLFSLYLTLANIPYVLIFVSIGLYSDLVMGKIFH